MASHMNSLWILNSNRQSNLFIPTIIIPPQVRALERDLESERKSRTTCQMDLDNMRKREEESRSSHFRQRAASLEVCCRNTGETWLRNNPPVPVHVIKMKLGYKLLSNASKVGQLWFLNQNKLHGNSITPPLSALAAVTRSGSRSSGDTEKGACREG